MTEFEKAIIHRLDYIIEQQQASIRTAWAVVGIDVEHEAYKAKYKEIQNRVNNKYDQLPLDQLGLEVEEEEVKNDDQG